MRKFYLLFFFFCIVTNISATVKSLKLVDNQLCTSDNKAIQLRGWSTHGSWFKNCYDDLSDFQKMKDTGANVVRIAQYVTEGEGVNETWVKNCIDYCARLDMYCIVDWHVVSPGNPNDNRYSDSKTFFQDISYYVKAKGYNHVLYEICSAPNKDEQGEPCEFSDVWGWIKDYSAEILPIIKACDPDAIVIVGTPQWDLSLDFPVYDPLDEMGMNVMYSFHYYATDQERYLGHLSTAAAFIPVFVSEWGVGSLNGGLSYNTKSSDKLMTVCNGKNLGNKLISWCNWAWCDHNESCAFTDYSTTAYSTAGNYVKSQLAQGDERIAYSESNPYGSPMTISGEDDFYFSLECFDEGGNNNAYYDYDESWVPCSPIPCNAGVAGMYGYVRINDYVDIGYTDENKPEDGYYSLSYLHSGEWIKYTLNVLKAGDYEMETYTNNHISPNLVAFSVDGRNALVDENGNEIYRGLKLRASHGGTSDGGWSDWGWTTPYSPVAPLKKFRIRFKSPGVHTLGIAFLTECSGLGSLKLKNCIPVTLSGDVNGDGSITMADANMVVNYFLSTDPSSIANFNVAAADVNGDKAITMADANQIVNIFLGQ